MTFKEYLSLGISSYAINFALFWSIQGYFGVSDTTSTACGFRTAGAIMSFYELKIFLTACI